MQCRSCDHHLIDKARFCDDCGVATASLELDADGLMSYCSKCSGLLRGSKKYCIYCGEPSPHSGKFKKKREASRLEQILMDPRVQIAIVGVMLILASLPAVTPIRYRMTSAAPFVTVEWEKEDRQVGTQRVVIPRQSRFTIQALVDDSDRTDGMTIAMAGGVTRDSKGNLYVSDSAGHRVYRIAPTGERSVFAGSGAAGFDGDGGGAASAQLDSPRGLAIDDLDRVYIADAGNNRIRLVDERGIIKTIAGSEGNPEEGGEAITRFSDADEATLLSPSSVSVDDDGTLYVAENACKIGKRKPTVWVLKQKL